MTRPISRLVALAAAGLSAAAGLAWSAVETPAPAKRVALVAALEGPIGPAAQRHVQEALQKAEERGAEVLVLRMNTPGGLATSMRDIISDILGSKVPVVGYVAPSGAHAASAGTYLLYATHVAAMAPGTNLGAATPVQIGGGGLPGMPKPGESPDKPGPDAEKAPGKEGEKGKKDEKVPEAPPPAPGDAMSKKAVNDAAAFIRSLAEMRGRNADWAEKAVREAASLTAKEAREKNVIDFVADDIPALLAAIDGRTVSIGGKERSLATQGIAVERHEPDFMTRLLGILANPNVALILMMVGIYGLIFEFANPGSIGPGVAGVICLVLGLYALNQLPLDYAGLALIVLGIVFMVAEAFTPTFGVLGVGGLIAFVIGSAMLIDTDIPAYQVSWWVIGVLAGLSALVLIVVVGWALRAHRRPTVDSVSRLIGLEAEVIDWAGGEGHVWAGGERWNARGDAGFGPGDTVQVRALEGLTLVVSPAAAGDAASADHATSQQQGA